MKKKPIRQFKPHRYKELRYDFNNPIYVHINTIRKAILWYLDEYHLVNHSEMAVMFNISRERIRQLFLQVRKNPDLAQLYCDVLKKYFPPENFTKLWEKYK